jgi:2'-5' RNA ligase
MRLFIAIQLSEEMKKALITCMHDLKKQGVEGNYTPAQNLHMTLAFIGEYDDAAKVREVIESVPLPQFRMSLSEKGNFGNLLWAGLKGNQKMKIYVKDLRAALKAADIPFDKDEFIPHITLIRKASAKKAYKVNLPKAEMVVKKVSLMKSEFKNGKVCYREM